MRRNAEIELDVEITLVADLQLSSSQLFNIWEVWGRETSSLRQFVPSFCIYVLPFGHFILLYPQTNYFLLHPWKLCISVWIYRLSNQIVTPVQIKNNCDNLVVVIIYWMNKTSFPSNEHWAEWFFQQSAAKVSTKHSPDPFTLRNIWWQMAAFYYWKWTEKNFQVWNRQRVKCYTYIF